MTSAEELKSSVLEKVRTLDDVRNELLRIEAEDVPDAGYVPLALRSVLDGDETPLDAITGEQHRREAVEYAEQIRARVAAE